MIPEFLSNSEILELEKQLEPYGISKLDFIFIKSGKDRIRALSPVSKKEIINLTDGIFTETLGLYFAKIDGESIRLSIDACHLLKEQITKKILELDDKQFEAYMKGHEVEFKEQGEKGYFILKHNHDLLGMAKISQGMIKNYLPKERRRKN